MPGPVVRLEQQRETLPAGFVWADEAARRLGISPKSLSVYRSQRRGPPFVAINGWRAAYSVAGLDNYLRLQAEAIRAKADERLAMVSGAALSDGAQP